jgi:8-oxo-dGTP pyrophosphatase MutT (NUDIX family)
MNEIRDLPNIHDYLATLRLRLRDAASVPLPVPGTEKKAAAVLIPIFERGGELRILYTLRSDRLISHSGQVSFPGGRFDRRDANLMTTALREAHEEVGIAPKQVEVLGTFPGRRTRSTQIMVTPIVGLLSGTLALLPDPYEVAEIFDVPLHALSDRRYRGRHTATNQGTAVDHPAIVYDGHEIWGLTYYFTLSFLALARADL